VRPEPLVAIGVPLYNADRFLPEALESLLAQRYRQLRLVLVDDASTDGTAEIAATYAALDGRIVYRRNERRLGMLANWRRAFDLATELFPEAEYFAWGSDHDVWHPRWLSVLLPVLERDPAVVLVYPLNLRISGEGSLLRGPWSFQTRGVKRAAERLARASLCMSAGNMVYGLYRISALRRAGVFRPVLAPDRLLLAELSLYGEFAQVPEILWYRRFTRLAGTARQRAALFAEPPPRSSYLPWWIGHTATLAGALVGAAAGHPDFGPGRGAAYTLVYLLAAVVVVVRSSLLAKYCRRAVRWLRLIVHLLRVRLGRQRLRRSLARLRAVASD
jgi:glycosyltransferase involved in cell wall biosynthesis